MNQADDNSELQEICCRWHVAWMTAIGAALILLGMEGCQSAIGQERDAFDQLGSAHSGLYGAEVVEFSVAGAKAFVVKPTRPADSGRKPWVWYAPSLRSTDGTWTLPTKRHADLMKSLLASGFYFCGVDVGESYGSPRGRTTFTAFYRRLVDQYQFSQQACLWAVSRGGLMHYTWAVEHPQYVRCIGAIYPVCNLRSYPPLEKLSRAYGIQLDQLENELEKHNPLERLTPLAKAGVPILHLHGDADDVVPLRMNSEELARRYRAAGGPIRLVIVKGKGHELAPEFWENPLLPAFFLEHGLDSKPNDDAE